MPSSTYIQAVGRRKNAIARVRLVEAAKTSFMINDHRDLAAYFPTQELQKTVTDAFSTARDGANTLHFSVTAHINGGGIAGQAVALRHGISRALTSFNKELRPKLKKAGFLKRDPRTKERRKFGLKKARKAPQWSKR